MLHCWHHRLVVLFHWTAATASWSRSVDSRYCYPGCDRLKFLAYSCHFLVLCKGLEKPPRWVTLLRGQKFHSSARNYKWNLERTSKSPQGTHPVGRVLWKELPVLSSCTLKYEGVTSIFWVLNVKYFCQYMGCSYKFDWVNINLTVIKGTLKSQIIYYSLMFFIAYTFKGQVHVFAGRVKIVSHSSCRTIAILKFFVPCSWVNESHLPTFYR